MIEDFLLHVRTVEKWILSCDVSDQIPVCQEAVDKLIVARFERFINEGIDKLIYFDNLVLLNEAIRNQTLIIASQTNIKTNEKLQPSNGGRKAEVPY